MFLLSPFSGGPERGPPGRLKGGGASRRHSLAGPPRMEVTASGFEATAEIKLPGGKRQAWHIRQDSRIWPD